jgi:hypothetical protein
MFIGPQFDHQSWLYAHDRRGTMITVYVTSGPAQVGNPPPYTVIYLHDRPTWIMGVSA